MGTLNEMAVDWKDQHAVTVVAASEVYPLKYPKGRSIRGLEIVPSVTNTKTVTKQWYFMQVHVFPQTQIVLVVLKLLADVS